MSSRLLAIEAALLLGSALLVWMIVSPPFGSSGGSRDAGGALVSENSDGTGDDTGDPPGGDDDGDDDDSGDDPQLHDDSCAPPVSDESMRGNQILTYYGNPDSGLLGILGQLEPAELVARVNEHARTYNELNGFRGIQPGFHLIYMTAQAHEGNDGLYARRLDKDKLEQYIQLACENEFFIFLDLQLGRADMETEINALLPYLRQSQVHLSLDPEFAMEPNEVPGQEIGHLDASQINRAQQILQDLVEENNLGDKVLIVHQFTDEMITNKGQIENFPRVRFVIDMDGFGEGATKLAKYRTYSAPAEYGGIKIFFHQDTPPLTEQEILHVRPDVVIYQ